MPIATVADVLTADRILMYGVTGSGKSTAATRLGEALGLSVHLVDEEIGWLPGWVPRPDEEQVQLVRQTTAQPRWVLDSAYGAWVDVVLDRAQVVVALDYPRAVSLGRLVRRTLARIVGRDQTCNGNTETWRTALSRDSIVVWHFRSFRRKRERAIRWETAPAGPKVLRLERPRDLEQLLAALAGSS